MPTDFTKFRPEIQNVIDAGPTYTMDSDCSADFAPSDWTLNNCTVTKNAANARAGTHTYRIDPSNVVCTATRNDLDWGIGSLTDDDVVSSRFWVALEDATDIAQLQMRVYFHDGKYRKWQAISGNGAIWETDMADPPAAAKYREFALSMRLGDMDDANDPPDPSTGVDRIYVYAQMAAPPYTGTPAIHWDCVRIWPKVAQGYHIIQFDDPTSGAHFTALQNLITWLDANAPDVKINFMVWPGAHAEQYIPFVEKGHLLCVHTNEGWGSVATPAARAALWNTNSAWCAANSPGGEHFFIGGGGGKWGDDWHVRRQRQW